MAVTPDLLDTYNPYLPADDWAQMRDSVLASVRPHIEDQSGASTRQALATLTGYVQWTRERGLVGQADDALTPRFIDVYTQHRSTQIRPQGAAREGAILRTLFSEDPLPRRAQAPPAPADIPYSGDDITTIRSWAAYQPSTRKRLDATAIAALGLGCGLTVNEMMLGRTGDVTVADNGDVDVTVHGPRPRAVPALHTWAPLLAELRSTAPERSDWLIGPGRTARDSHSLNDIRRNLRGDIRPVPQRMRNTWLVTHVNGGTPVSVLMNAAGLLDAAFLRRLAPYIDMPSAREQRTMLRNGGAHA
ncbi:hypothetical protein ASF87_10145 [Microbacterium sp. Leaf161]|uniref:hypothetical protein n=1 Tax=Microbacterium sp. Leaf161 TaxID=1736281 RepID=UPI0006F2BB69|nr:hypothetical protein [Microbacterium sp. Leaf161]KQR49146.1 hypothetical protein ASF87_10145 [Microbacterium sp. Leaf161]